ncbi:MAG: GNAT family N-acetyltransferase [Rikenellaceae bacterium]
MKTQLLSLNDKDLWDDYIKRLPIDQQDVYFTPEYYSLYENYGDGEALCFVYEEDENIALYPFLKNSINKLGYNLDDEYFDIQGAYGYNGMITSSKDENFIERFHIAFSHYCEDNNIVAEFTRFHPILSNHTISDNNMKVISDRKTMYLDLDSPYENIFNNFQKTTKKQINRCKDKYDLSLDVVQGGSCSAKHINTFYEIYLNAMNRVHSSDYLYFNRNYFSNLFSLKDVTLFIAIYEKKPIAIISTMSSSMYIHGHLGGALTDYLHISAFSFLYSEIFKYGMNKGCRYYNGGGGTSSCDDDNLLKFKLNFSKTTQVFYIGKYIRNNHIYENIISQWKNKFPESYEKNKVKLLGYRDI